MVYGALIALIALFLASPMHAGVLVGHALTPEGLGSLKIGMTAEDAAIAVGEELDEADLSEECTHFRLEDGAVTGMVIEGKIARISVRRDFLTAEGIGIGATEARVKKTYAGRFSISDNEYEQGGHYIRVKLPQDKGYMFETVNGMVTDIHAGKYPAVGYIEGCF